VQINPGYRSNLSRNELARIKTLSPRKRALVEHSLQYSNNEALDDLLRHYDGGTDDPVIRLLLDQEFKDAVAHGAAGKGYRYQGAEPSTSGESEGKYLLKADKFMADKHMNYSPEEQAALEILALRKELDFIQGAKVDPIDERSILYQMIARHNAANIRPTSIKEIGEGGIDNKRRIHPDLPPQTLANAMVATNNQLMDNLLNNERHEQPITNIDKNGFRSGIPVEHKLPFKGHEALGREPSNRMLGSTFKNSVIRSEGDPYRQQVLLLRNAAELEDAYRSNYGRDVREYMTENDWNYKPNQSVMPRLEDFSTVDKGERKLTSKKSIMKSPLQMAGSRPEAARALELASGTRTDSPGDSKERALYINSGGGDVSIGEGVLRSNGNGKHKNGNRH